MKELFSSNEDFRKSAFLNWRLSPKEDIQNFIVLADGYISSSLHLIDLCLANTSDAKADKLIFPILHNANHGMELYLKAIIWTINELNKTGEKFDDNCHELNQLFNETIEIIKKYEDLIFFEDFKEKSIILYCYINEIYAVLTKNPFKNSMTFSRYPISSTNKNTKQHYKQFYTEKKENIEIDLENLKEILEEIYLFLDERVSYLYFNKLKEDY